MSWIFKHYDMTTIQTSYKEISEINTLLLRYIKSTNIILLSQQIYTNLQILVIHFSLIRGSKHPYYKKDMKLTYHVDIELPIIEAIAIQNQLLYIKTK